MLQDKLNVFLLPVFTHPKFGSSQEKFDNWPRPKSYIALMLCEVILLLSLCVKSSGWGEVKKKTRQNRRLVFTPSIERHSREFHVVVVLVPVVQTLDGAIHRINYYPAGEY